MQSLRRYKLFNLFVAVSRSNNLFGFGTIKIEMTISQNAYRNEVGSVVGTIPHESMSSYFIKHSKNDMSCWLLAFEISKLKST